MVHWDEGKVGSSGCLLVAAEAALVKVLVEVLVLKLKMDCGIVSLTLEENTMIFIQLTTSAPPKPLLH